MASIKIKGDTSGEIALTVPGVAGTNTLTLPASTGNVIVDDGSGNVAVSGNVTVSGTLNDATIEDSGWLVIGQPGAPAFQNSWVDYGAGYGETRIRKINGVVHMEGIVKSGSAANAHIFYLPVGWRPRQNVIMAGLANNAFGRLQVDYANGAVYYQTGGSTAWQSVWCSFVAHN